MDNGIINSYENVFAFRTLTDTRVVDGFSGGSIIYNWDTKYKHIVGVIYGELLAPHKGFPARTGIAKAIGANDLREIRRIKNEVFGGLNESAIQCSRVL